MAFRAVATSANCAGVGDAPVPTVTGDHLTAYVVVLNTTDVVVGPGGWTRQISQGDTNANLSQLTVWTKIAVSEGDSWLWTGITGYCDIAVWADDTATGLDAIAATAVNTTTSPNSPTISTTGAGERVRPTLHCNGGVTISAGPSGTTLRFAYDGVSAGAEIVRAPVGATGVYNWGTITSNVFVTATDALAVVRLAYPTSDVSAGSWTAQDGSTTSLYSYVDESPASDTDYLQSSTDPTSDAVTLGLGTLTDPGVDTGHVLRYRIRRG